jgi:two-component system, OmpR family, KDP operon response regulator KdpE
MSRDLRILVIDDEHSIRRFLHTALSASQYVVMESENGINGVHLFEQHRPDLVILDIGLPDIDGVEVTRRIREHAQTPIIILSIIGSEAMKVAALDAGADDYLTKPFGTPELLARIRVALRRTPNASTPAETQFTIGNLYVDLDQRLVRKGDEEVHLTPIEYNLLRYFVLNLGKVLRHTQILNQVWGGGYENETHLLRVNISNLRAKLEADPNRPRHLTTEPGVGYRFRE